LRRSCIVTQFIDRHYRDIWNIRRLLNMNHFVYSNIFRIDLQYSKFDPMERGAPECLDGDAGSDGWQRASSGRAGSQGDRVFGSDHRASRRRQLHRDVAPAGGRYRRTPNGASREIDAVSGMTGRERKHPLPATGRRESHPQIVKGTTPSSRPVPNSVREKRKAEKKEAR
jgi:hypothetical protein